MRRVIYRRRGLRGLGYPVLPDQLITAAGVSEAFSPQTPDSTMISILQSQGQSLPADLAAKWAAAQGSWVTDPSQSPANPAPGALTPAGQPVSTQTGQPVTLLTTIAVAPGVWNCMMSDGSSHYCDSAGKPISYTPPAPVAVTTPAAASQPTAVVSPIVTPAPQSGITSGSIVPIAVTPAGTQISSTTGTPAVLPAAAQSTLDSLMTWLQGSLIGGVPNWVLLGGVAAALFMFGGNGSSHRR
jgi:hypothetical protein